MVIEHQETIAALQLAARPLAGLDDVDPILEEIGDATLVLLGEATHGTHEFYKLRTEISKRLIADRGFAAIAVEADWPHALRISHYLYAVPSAQFDALVHIDETRALTPLDPPIGWRIQGEPETYPTGI